MKPEEITVTDGYRVRLLSHGGRIVADIRWWLFDPVLKKFTPTMYGIAVPIEKAPLIRGALHQAEREYQRLLKDAKHAQAEEA